MPLSVQPYQTGHLITSGSPSLAAGAGAGTGPSVQLTGADSAGVITVTTGTLPTAAATVVEVTFGSAFDTAPAVVLSPGNAVTALLSGVTMARAVASTTVLTLTAGSTGLTAATTYVWNYVTVGW